MELQAQEETSSPALRLDARSREWVERCAREAGFDVAGVASVPEPGSEQSQADDQRFAEWIEAGHAGEMEWLKRVDESGELVRGELHRSMPWARSVVVCAFNYNTSPVKSIDSAAPTAGWIARYAWSGVAGSPGPEDETSPLPGSDYHNVLLERLRSVEQKIRGRFSDVQTRCYVDTGPILERGYAARAGVGWIGKNTCVLNQDLGSWMLLGVIVTSLELAPEARVEAAANRCGSCTRCIDACPTDALIAPREMDASRCISYLTIEKKGAIDENLRDAMGRQVFGCDICQDVCPWNRKAPIATGWPVRPQLINPELEWLASMDGPTFNRWFRGSPLERTRRKRVLRNVALAMGNSGEQKFLPKLEEWERGEDDVLAEAARWAIRKLRPEGANDQDGTNVQARNEGVSINLKDMAQEQVAAETKRDTATVAEAPKAGKEPLSKGLVAATAAPVEKSGTWEQIKALGHYMSRTEVHTYAFSVAAQVILSLFPFIVLLLTICIRIFHSKQLVAVVTELMTHFLPESVTTQQWVMRNMQVVAYSHPQVKIISVVMLLITTTGVFLPLEVALNSVWGVKKNRSYVRNQIVSLGLATGVAVLALASIALSAVQRTILGWIFFGHTQNVVFTWLTQGFLNICAVLASIGLFFLVYWGLPNRKIPARTVLPTAIVVGLLWEAAKYVYILVLPLLDFRAVYGPFEVSVGLMMWAFISGLLLLAGAYVSATRQALREAHQDDIKRAEKADD